MSLQDRLDRHASALDALTVRARPGNPFPYPTEHTNWRDEQRAWSSTAILFNQSWHMTDLYVSGPDTTRLLTDTSVNTYKTFGTNKAKQYLALAPNGYVVGDVILFGLEDDLVSLVGQESAINWIRYQAEVGGYDVTFERYNAGWGRLGAVPKREYRYEVEGPTAWKIIEQAAGRAIDPIGFFRMGDIEIAGRRVRVLNHTMGGVPGEDATGLELFGPEEDHEVVLEALLTAGADHGLVRGGSQAYGSTTLESGWIGNVVPGIYTDESLRAYREQLPEDTQENGFVGIAGSYRPDTIEGFYSRPWDLGYGHMVKLDHDFIGREALEAVPADGRRRKVWLTWNHDDVAALAADAQLDRGRGRDLPQPYSVVRDAVYVGDDLVGLTQLSGHTAGLGGMSSIATVDEAVADGAEVEILWGDFDGGAGNPFIPNHTQRRVRARLSDTSPIL